jgi:hypothetical protein
MTQGVKFLRRTKTQGSNFCVEKWPRVFELRLTLISGLRRFNESLGVIAKYTPSLTLLFNTFTCQSMQYGIFWLASQCLIREKNIFGVETRNFRELTRTFRVIKRFFVCLFVFVFVFGFFFLYPPKWAHWAFVLYYVILYISLTDPRGEGVLLKFTYIFSYGKENMTSQDEGDNWTSLIWFFTYVSHKTMRNWFYLW